jgi:hypothetical protein
MYIFGGVFAQPGPNERDCIYSLDSKSMVWKENKTNGASPQLEQRRKGNCVYYDKNLYCFTTDGRITTCFKLDLSRDSLTWENTACSGVSPPLDDTAMVIVNNTVFCWGGNAPVGTANYTNMPFYRCPLDTLQWALTQGNNTPLQRSNHVMFVYNGMVHVIGGHSASPSLPYPSMALFKLEVGNAYSTWRANDLRGVSPASREGHTATIWNNKIIVFGGIHNNWSGGTEPMDFGDTNVIDLSTDSWWPVEQIRGGNHAPSPRHNHSAVLIGNNVVFFGGVRDGRQNNDLYILSLAGDKNEAGLEAALAQSANNANNKPTAVRLEKAFNNENMFPDVSFKVKDKTFFAHKAVLSARSSVFKKRFEVAPRSRSSFDTDVSRSEIEVSASEKEKKPLRSPKPVRVVDSPSPERKNTKDSSSSSSGKDDDVVKEKIDLSPSAQKLNYSTEKARIIEDIAIPDDWLVEDFEVVLKYIYTGKATVKSQQQAERVSAIGFEYLLDNLMKFCQRCTAFPSSFAEDDVAIATQLRKMVGSPIGSDLSFIVKRKKLFAHKVLVACFSDSLGETLMNERVRKYIDVPCMDSESRHLNSFIEFMRLVYSNFSVISAAKVKELDLGDLMAIAITYKEPRLYQILAQPNVLSNENVGSIYEVAKENNLEAVSKVCFNYLNKYFSTIVRDQNVVSKWSPAFVKELLSQFEAGTTTWNWLDIMWLAHNRAMTELENKAVVQLSQNINVDNVVQILIGAHHCGAKGLRSECVDYLLRQSVVMEQYSRIRATNTQIINSLSGLSISLNNEMSQKVSTQVSNLKDPALKNNKSCTICSSTFSHFGNKKHSCTLCKRIICNDCLQKGQKLPKVFGYKEKSKNVCVTCNQLVSLITTSPTQAEETKAK